MLHNATFFDVKTRFWQYIAQHYARLLQRQSGGWTNKLIWGNNNLVFSGLKNWPRRPESEAAGGVQSAVTLSSRAEFADNFADNY